MKMRQPHASITSVAFDLLLAFGAVTAATVLRLFWLEDYIGTGTPFILYYPLVAAIALLRNTRSGAVATVFSAVAAAYYFFMPTESFSLADPVSITKLALFIMSCGLILLACELSNRTRHKLVKRNREFITLSDSLNMAMEAAHAGSFDWDARTDHNKWSAELLSLYGLTPESFGGTYDHWLSCVIPEDQEKAAAAVKTSLKTGKFLIEFRIRRADTGEIRWMDGKGQVFFDKYGVPERMVSINIDISERKQAELELQQAKQNAEKASQAKTEFLTNMSHEIRTPLNAIVGLTGLLKRGSVSPEKQQLFYETLDSSTQQLLRLVNDLLDISKIESANIKLEEIAFSPLEIVRECISIIRVQAQDKGLNLHVEKDIPHGLRLTGDPLRIRQIIMNLLSNAVKFTEAGSVHLIARCAPGSGNPTAQFMITVRDTGIGIPPEATETIFEKFTQADASITRKHGGTGLGLAITRSLVEMMNGHISLKSAPGEGSEFTVILPLPCSTSAYKDTDLPQQNHFSHAPHKILLVDDYTPNLMVAKTIVNQAGYDCETAASGYEVLDKLKRDEFSLILMDIQMPGMDGFETTQHIRLHEEKQQLPRTPVIAMTAHAMSGYGEKCLEAGMDDYITKPFNPDELIAKVKSSLASYSEAAA